MLDNKKDILKLNDDLDSVCDKMNFPVSQWAGQCYAVSVALLDFGIIKGYARYGSYTGYIDPESMFYGDCHNDGVSRHGWIELEDGTIVDPTRWVFEHKDPYIYVGKNDCYEPDPATCYDEYRQHEKPPAYKESSKNITMSLSDGAREMMHRVLREKREGVSFTPDQLMWCCKANPLEYGVYRGEIYHALKAVGYRPHILEVNWEKVMEYDDEPEFRERLNYVKQNHAY